MIRTDADARAASKALSAFPATYSLPYQAEVWHLIGLAPSYTKGADAAWYHLPCTGLYLRVLMDADGVLYVPQGSQPAAAPRWQDMHVCDDVTTLAQRQLPMTAAAQDSVNRMGKGDADQKAVADLLAALYERPHPHPDKQAAIVERAKRVVAKVYKGREWPWWARYHLLGADIPAGADPGDTRARAHVRQV